MGKPLIIRLCNWVGEAVLALPGLLALEAQGYDLHLVGKRWAQPLFKAHGWPVSVRPAKRRDAIAQLCALRIALARSDADFCSRVNTVLLTNSFSSALEARLAGLRPIGYGKEGRSFLLGHVVPFATGLHAADNYWRIVQPLLRDGQPRPAELGLRVSSEQLETAASLLKQAEITGRYIVLCPFSGAADTTGKKLWPAFPQLAALLRERGHTVLMCPGPGEEAQANQGYTGCNVLTSVDLGVYAALMARSDFVVSNDTGPGHIAAGVGARLVSVFGPGSIRQWAPLGEKVELQIQAGRWPSLDEVLQAIDRAMQR